MFQVRISISKFKCWRVIVWFNFSMPDIAFSYLYYIFFSVVHFGHGILSYYMLHFLDGEEEPFFIFRKNRFNMKERIMKPIKSGLGLITTLFLALAFEVAENSPIVIAFFRKNSGIMFKSFPKKRIKKFISLISIIGTSEEYRGDSAVNVIGDLLSCSLGYNLARYVYRLLG